jgi:hypothetical protein
MTAARWAQEELLEKHPRTNLRVYAVWFNMYPGDARARWSGALLTDARVVNLWDEQRAVGKLYLSRLAAMIDRRAAASLQPSDDAIWDAFFLYGPGDRWQEPVPFPVVWGYPIVPTRDELQRKLEALVRR